MKRIAWSLALVTGIIACSKSEQNVPESKTVPFEFTASIENSNTKADLVRDGETDYYNTLWRSGDRVGLFVYKSDWSGGITYLTLSDGEDTSIGTFGTWPTGYNNSGMKWNKFSFYPFERYTSDSGAASEIGTSFDPSTSLMTVVLPNSYYQYQSGRSYMPIVADMSGVDENPSVMNFKQIGGAVRVSITGVPGSANCIRMVVKDENGDDLNVTGNFSFKPTEAGSAAISTPVSGGGNKIWINFATDSGSRNFDFIFPVPTLTNPYFEFAIYDHYSLKIWEKKASNQQDISRAKMLSLSKAYESGIDMTKFYLRGWINGADVENNSIQFNANGEIDSYTFNSDSYLYLFNSTIYDGTGKAYIPSSSEEANAYVDCHRWDSWDKSTCPKLKVPAGTYKLSIAYNDVSGAVRLSYESK